MRSARAGRVAGRLLLGAMLIAWAPGAFAGDAGAGFEAHVDPETGELIEPPARLPRSGAVDEAVPGAPAPDGSTLREERGRAGGVTVELGGAFRSTMRATVAPGGGVETRCDGGHPTAGAERAPK